MKIKPVEFSVAPTGSLLRSKILSNTALLFTTICILALGLWSPSVKAQTPVIFDSDMSSDWDDISAMAVLESLADNGECQIIGCMVSSINGATPLCMNAINTYYGRSTVPVGVRPDIGGIGGYPGQIASEFPHPLYQSASQCPLAVNLYRQLLASQPDHSVVIVVTGYLTNLKALLQSGSDAYSPLSGSALVAQKVKLLSAMGGEYPNGTEFNFMSSGDDSAYVVVNNWPAPVMYDGFEIGATTYSGGSLVSGTGIQTNPIAEVWRIKGGAPHTNFDPVAVYHGIRMTEGLWGANMVGINNCLVSGSNWWTATPNPGTQGYLLEIERYPQQLAIDTLVNASWAPKSGAAKAPTQPTNPGAAIVNNNRIDLEWTDNSYNETGFIIERKINGIFTQIGSAGANVNHYSDTAISSATNCAYRVKAYNAIGSSGYAYITVYSGWTEVNFTTPTDLPLYTYYTPDNLEWSKSTRPNHVALNNDSTHGQNVTINAMVGSQGTQGTFYVYFFYQDPNNWYRLSADGTSSKFQKSINSTISQIGTTGTAVNIAGGSMLQAWQIAANSSGALSFTVSGSSILNVSDTLSFSSGKIGLGGSGRAPVWQNFSFDTTGSGGAIPVITSGTSAAGTVGSAFSYNITATNNPASYNATGLPAGLSVNTSSGAITGTPTASGTSSVTLKAINTSGTGTATLTLVVSPVGGAAPVITSATSTSGTVGSAFSYNITATNGPTSYNATGLPAGLSVNTSSGVITGTPTASGTSSVTLRAINTSGTGTATLTLTVSPSGGTAPVITSATSASGTVGSAFSYNITATNSPTSYNATGLPAGLSVNTSSGAITGTPTTSGTSSVTLKAINTSGTGTTTLTLTVNPSGGAAPVITSATSASATVGSAFSYNITATNSPTSYNATGLPAGLSVNTSSGAITGTPTTSGTSSVTLKAINTSGTGTATLTLTANAASGLPAPWVNQDVGSVPAAGSASYSGGTFTVAGSGNITYGTTADQFQYAYQMVSGDCTITARVVSASPAATKAGVMIRETTSGGSSHKFEAAAAGSLLYYARTSTGGSSSKGNQVTGALPYWVRLQRVGNVITSYYSTSGASGTWVQGSVHTISMASSSVTVGLAATSTGSTLGTATFDNVSVTTP